MKQRKALFVLNVIVFVILIICLILDAIIFVGMIDAKNDMQDPDQMGAGLGLAILLALHVYLLIPYFVCLVVSIVSLCCKYFNWLSIANASMCGVAVILTVIMFLIP